MSRSVKGVDRQKLIPLSDGKSVAQASKPKNEKANFGRLFFCNVSGWYRDRLPGLALDIRNALKAFKAAVEAGEVARLHDGSRASISYHPGEAKTPPKANPVAPARQSGAGSEPLGERHLRLRGAHEAHEGFGLLLGHLCTENPLYAFLQQAHQCINPKLINPDTLDPNDLACIIDIGESNPPCRRKLIRPDHLLA